MDLSLIFNFVTAILMLLVPGLAPDSPTTTMPMAITAEVVSVIDGDTIIVRLNGKKETVRYIGIDTSEPRREGAPECGSHEATEYNRELVDHKMVRLVADTEDRDQYGRLLRYVYQGEGTEEVFVNRALVQNGLAKPLTIPPNDTFVSDFKSVARTAAAEQIGNWALCPDF